MSNLILTYAENLTDNNDDIQVMLDYASVVLGDNPQERKNNNLLRREKHLKYKERNRRK